MSAYTEAVERNLKGLEAVSTGNCPGCNECSDANGDPYFSWSPCEICGSRLGGDRESWHALMDNKLIHCENACVDCVVYLANGDEPENWDQ
jgi:hypothetical protein